MNRAELATVAESLLRRLEEESAEPGCFLDPFVKRNLEGFILRVREARTPEDIDNAGALLGRFSVDSLEWDSPLMREFGNLADLAHRVFSDLRDQESLRDE